MHDRKVVCPCTRWDLDQGTATSLSNRKLHKAAPPWHLPSGPLVRAPTSGDVPGASKRAAWKTEGAAPRVWARGVAQPSAHRPRTTIIATKTSSQRNRRSPGSSRDMSQSYDM
jgi:hypothetical protein